MDSIKILMCGNEKVFRGILLTTLSIIKYTSSKIELFIGTMDLRDIDERYLPITEEERQTVEALLMRKNPSSRAYLHNFGDSFRRELINSKNMSSAYTPYAMARLFADEIPEFDDKMLYLDTDVLLLGNVEELYATDIEGYHIAGARDYFGKFFFSPRYLNSGVLLFNMKEMRKDGIFKKCRQLCNERKMLLFDQHAINKFAKKKLILNRRFNEQHKTKKSTVVRHFAMTIKWFPYFHTEAIKPWQPELIQNALNDHSFDDIFDEYETLVKDFPKAIQTNRNR